MGMRTDLSSVLCMVLALAACSGDDDDDGAGGDSGKGGGGGASGSSGSMSAGRGGAGSGGTSAGSGGTGGMGGMGGNQTMNPAACPATAPASDTACNMLDLECTYGAMECDCDEQGGAMALSWDCRAGGAPMMQMCPATEPASGTTCTEGRGECEFGAKICDCNDDLWACWDPAVDCPAMPPAADSACSPVGMECEYGDGECDCEDTGWECDDDVTGMPDADAGT